ncbi:uncharacterized protein LOC107981889 [Nasonia vitripennis]|uniref:Uncharacterized protein n=1 Tax=Nasonia vitripennis TaxID=7425 RepID=A0A7M7Q4Y2_NASVI|nr:uncharacterized protein LOC107981889 [Nasonia vitripennis]
MYYEVIFPVPGGDPCENCLHCLTELGIGLRMNSIVSVIPTQCAYRGLLDEKCLKNATEKVESVVDEEKTAWKIFVSSIRSKLTVKQVVDGVRSGGDLTFDYFLLVLTADCLAALGLIENSATNVVAAMLVSPLMGPVMSLTFGSIIADKELQSIGLKSLCFGICLSILFGFIFGLILGTTKMPWGYNDWPTDEMKGRGNFRSLWMGVLWALPSGTGVAVALLQGSNGPLIGVAISASLLPPVVNCGLFWALGCIWIIYKPTKIPHIKGESMANFTSAYTYIYADYIPIEFFCNGLISACLTLVNVICIFITAIIVLKVKEVAAPYTSTPEIRRFWEHDIRLVRNENITRNNSMSDCRNHTEISEAKKKEFEKTLNEAVLEAVNDDTFRKIQRVSYGQFKPNQISSLIKSDRETKIMNNESDTKKHFNELNSFGIKEDLDTLERLVNQLLIKQTKDKDNKKNDNWSNIKTFRNDYISLLPTNDLTTIHENCTYCPSENNIEKCSKL